MKKYIYTQQVEAVQWTGGNRMEIQEALGKYFSVFKGIEYGESLLKIYESGQVGTKNYKMVYENDWVAMNKVASYVGKIEVVSNTYFQLHFKVIKDSTETKL